MPTSVELLTLLSNFDSTEWLRSDSRRTAVGLDLDLEALDWCMENNIPKVGADGFSRISLFHGNVLQPLQSKLIKNNPQELMRNVTLAENRENVHTGVLESDSQAGSASQDDKCIKRNIPLPARDIVCAFNYSCCCLHKRADLVLYFKHTLSVLSPKGGIFVMDLYGGTSSENKLRLQRRFPNFTVCYSCYKCVTFNCTRWKMLAVTFKTESVEVGAYFGACNVSSIYFSNFIFCYQLVRLMLIGDCTE